MKVGLPCRDRPPPPLHTRAYNSSAASYRRGGGLHERSRQLHRWGARTTYRRTRERTHGGLRERPLTPDLLHHPSLTYVLHQLFHLLPARLNTLIVLLTFTCQVWAFKYIFGSVLVFHTFLLSDIFDHFYHRSRRIIGGGCIYDFLSIVTYAWGQSPLSTWSTVCC